jgi:hypothetical protein
MNNISFVSGQSEAFIEMKLKSAKSFNRKVEIPIKQALLKKLKKKLKDCTFNFLGENSERDDCGIDVDDIIIVLDNETLNFICVQMVICELYSMDNSKTFKMSIYKNKSYYKGEEIKDKNAKTAGKAFYDELSALLTTNRNPLPDLLLKPSPFKKRLF